MFGLQKEPLALPKVLLSVHWNDASQVDEAHRLLFKWRRMSPLAALELLDAKFPDPVVRAGARSCVMIPQRRVLTNSLVQVRAYAVSRLESLSDSDLQLYMLQLTQVLKFEAFIDSALVCGVVALMRTLQRNLTPRLFVPGSLPASSRSAESPHHWPRPVLVPQGRDAHPLGAWPLRCPPGAVPAHLRQPPRAAGPPDVCHGQAAAHCKQGEACGGSSSWCG